MNIQTLLINIYIPIKFTTHTTNLVLRIKPYNYCLKWNTLSQDAILDCLAPLLSLFSFQLQTRYRTAVNHVGDTAF